MNIIGLIPVRLESSRLPSKAILEIAEIPMILHVAKRAQLSQSLDRVVVCTDSYKICDMCVENEKLFTPIFEYSTPGLPMNQISNLMNVQRPEYIKIDVDGIEHLILEGASDVLKDKYWLTSNQNNQLWER